MLIEVGYVRRGKGDRGLVASVTLFAAHINTLECLGRLSIDRVRGQLAAIDFAIRKSRSDLARIAL